MSDLDDIRAHVPGEWFAWAAQWFVLKDGVHHDRNATDYESAGEAAAALKRWMDERR